MGAARNVVIVTAGWSCCHSREESLHLRRVHCGIETRVGRKGASSVSGTGFVAQAPYAAVVERRMILRTPTATGRVGAGARPLDVHTRHQWLVGDRIDDCREVHEHVRTLQQRLQVVTGDVHAVQLEVWGAPGGFAQVEADDAIDVGFGLQALQQSLPEEARDAGDGDGFGCHESP